MTRLRVAAAALVTGGRDRTSARAAPKGSPWGACYFPDVSLTTQDGKTVRFYSDLVKDKFVVVNFIYTHCTKSCPLETANLVRVQKRLGARVGRDIFMYSLTLDPQRDTPEVLKAYAQAFHAGPGWLFLTGKREDLDLIRARFRDRTTVEDHAVSLLIGNDRAGQWTSLSAVDDPGFLAMNIDGWMSIDPMKHSPVKSYADAPRAARPPAGEDLFRQKCAACHAIGRGDLLGPDLAGVTRRRDRAWLARWLANPEKLVMEKDPLALELAGRSGKVAMPNLGLSGAEVEALIAYLAGAASATGPTVDRRYPTSRSRPGSRFGLCVRRSGSLPPPPRLAAPSTGWQRRRDPAPGSAAKGAVARSRAATATRVPRARRSEGRAGRVRPGNRARRRRPRPPQAERATVAIDPQLLLGRAERDQHEVGLGGPQARQCGRAGRVAGIERQERRVGAGQRERREERPEPLARLVRHALGSAEQVHAPAAPRRPVGEGQEEVRARDLLRHRRAEEARRPHHRHAVGERQLQPAGRPRRSRRSALPGRRGRRWA